MKERKRHKEMYLERGREYGDLNLKREREKKEEIWRGENEKPVYKYINTYAQLYIYIYIFICRFLPLVLFLSDLLPLDLVLYPLYAHIFFSFLPFLDTLFYYFRKFKLVINMCAQTCALTIYWAQRHREKMFSVSKKRRGWWGQKKEKN